MGCIANLVTRRNVRNYKRPGDYETVTLRLEHINKYKKLQVHRILGMLFLPPIPPGVNVDDLEINHIDGDKHNNDLDNIEWVTPSMNIKHAFATGLQRTVPVIVETIATGEYQRFHSTVQANEYLNAPDGSLSPHLYEYEPRTVPYKGHYVYLANRDSKPRSFTHRTYANSKVVATCADTSKEIIFDTLKATGKFFGVTTAAIHWQMYKRKSKAPYKGYYLRFEDDVSNSD